MDSEGCRVGTCTTLGTRELKLLETVNLRLPQLQYTQTWVNSVSCVDVNLKSVGLTQVTWGCSLYLTQLARLLDRTPGRLRFGWSHTTSRLQVLGWCHSTSKRRSPFDGSARAVGIKLRLYLSGLRLPERWVKEMTSVTVLFGWKGIEVNLDWSVRLIYPTWRWQQG